MLSFLVSGQLYADYDKISSMLGLPSCCKDTFHAIIEKLEGCVTELAEWSCSKTREAIKARGDDERWVASFDAPLQQLVCYHP